MASVNPVIGCVNVDYAQLDTKEEILQERRVTPNTHRTQRRIYTYNTGTQEAIGVAAHPQNSVREGASQINSDT